jgi:hypothetical protein
LSDFDFSSEDSTSLEEDEQVNHKKKEGDFTRLCLMTRGGSSRNDSDSDFDVSDDLTYDGLLLKCINLRMPCIVKTCCFVEYFVRTKILIFSLKTLLLKLLPSCRCTMMSAKPCKNCNMIMVNYTDLWIMHAQVASQLKGAKLELKELKAHSSLLGSCISCPMLKYDLEDSSIEIKDLKQRLDHSSRYRVFSPLVKFVGLLRLSFCMLPKRTPS